MYYTPYDTNSSHGNVNDTTDLSFTSFTDNTPMNINRNAHLSYNPPVEEQSLSQPSTFRSSTESSFSRAISRPYSSDISEPASGSEQPQYIQQSKPFSSNLAASWSYSADSVQQLKVHGVNNRQVISGSMSSLDTFPPPPPIAPVYRLSSTIPSATITTASGTRIDDNSSSSSFLYDSSQQDIYTDIPDTSQIDEKMEEYNDVFTYRILLSRDDPIGPCCICYSSDLIPPMLSTPQLLQQQSATPSPSPSPSPPPVQPTSNNNNNNNTSSFRKSIANSNNSNNNSPSIVTNSSITSSSDNNNNNNNDHSISPITHDNNNNSQSTPNSINNNSINNYWIILTCVQYHCSHTVHAMCLLHSNYNTLHLSHLPAIQPYPRIIPHQPPPSLLYNGSNDTASKIQMSMIIESPISANKFYASHFYLPVLIKENHLLYCSLRNEEFKIRPITFPFSQINFAVEIFNDIGVLYYHWNWVLQFDPHSPLMCYLLLDHETGNRITLYVKPSTTQLQSYEICEFQLDFSPYETWLYYPILNNPNTIGTTAVATAATNILPPPPPPNASSTTTTSNINVINTQPSLIGLTPQQQQQQQQPSLLLPQSPPPPPLTANIPPNTNTPNGYVNTYNDLNYTSPYASLYLSPNELSDVMLVDPLQPLNSSTSSLQSVHSTGRDDNNSGSQSTKKKSNRNRNGDNMNGEIPTNLLELGCSQSGSKRLQDLITNGDNETIAKLCNETLPYIFDLSTNMFGNYFIQKLFIAANDELKCNLLNSLKPRMTQLACHKMGTYPFQNIIKDLKTDQHAEIIAEGLMMDINSVLTNHFGVHVLQKFQHQFSHKAQQWLFDYINDHMKEVATNQQGIVVLKGCIEVGSVEQRQDTIEHILKYCKEFSIDEYGNYAIQSMIDHADDKIKVINEIYKNLKGEIANLCKNKFSSNVIEKCLSCESDTRKAIINEILASPDFNSILADKYGNYVIQYLITIVDSTQKPVLAKKIKSYLPKIEKEGKVVTTKWKNYISTLEK